MKKLINWSELSRIITGGDRNCIRAEKIPKKHTEALDELFFEKLPEWWKNKKNGFHQPKDIAKINKKL